MKDDAMFDKALLELRGMRGAVCLLIISSLIQSALVVGQVFALSFAIVALSSRYPTVPPGRLIAAFVACLIVRRIVQSIQEALLDRYADKQASLLENRLLSLIFDGHATMAQRLGTAGTATTATEGIDEVARYIRLAPQKAAALIGISAPLVIALLAIDWVSGTIVLVAFPIVALYMQMLGKQARQRAEAQLKTYQVLSNHFIDTLRGLPCIEALDATVSAAKSVFKASEKLRETTVRTLSIATLSSAILDLICVFAVAGVAMMLAFRLMDGSTTLTVALIALMLAPECLAPVRSFASDFHASLDGQSALHAVMETLALEDRRAADAAAEATSAPCTWTAQSALQMQGVSLAYDSAGKEALRNASFTLQGHEKVAIVGASGAGKSTLVDVLAGFRAPSHGSFLLDGKKLDSLDAETWRAHLHYIPQHPYVFRGTLLDNLRFYSPDAIRGDAVRAAQAVGLDGLIDDLPQGLDTQIGEGNRGLSGGQAQRVALARVMLDDRPILLLDEPTAHLDIETELELKQRMLPLMENRLVVLATHRLHWLSDVDRVIVMEDGEIVETGTPAELLAHDGALARFAAAEQEAVAS